MQDAVSLRRQFETENKWAKVIIGASAQERPRAYADAYTEFYRLFPDVAMDEQEESNRNETSLAFLQPFVGKDKTVVEIGAGRCHLALAVAPHVKLMIALDIAHLSATDAFPANFEHRLFNGIHLPDGLSEVDLVISDNVLEHLHPEDAAQQTVGAFKILKPGGTFVILTPNKANGPHDVSTYFSRTPSGLHLKEYSTADVKELFEAAGFADVRAYIGAKGRYQSIAPALAALIEGIAQHLPRKLMRSRYLRWLLPNRFSARKPAGRR